MPTVLQQEGSRLGVVLPSLAARLLCGMHIFQNFPCTLGETSKSVSFSRVYVCVKAKLTLVSFFFTFFFAPSP